MTLTSQQPRVGFFTTCLIESLRPGIGMASIRLLEQAGCRVEVPVKQSCCGQPAFNSGATKVSRSFAKMVIDVFEPFNYLVAASGSCLATIKQDYAQLLADDSRWKSRHEQLAEKSYELFSFLCEQRHFVPKDVSYEGKLAYHHSCSGLRSLKIYEQPRKLLGYVQGAEVVDIPHYETCCGFGGTFAVKYPEISTAITDDKINNIVATGADTLTGGDLGCLLNLAGRLSRRGLPIRTFHAAEILAGMADRDIFGQKL